MSQTFASIIGMGLVAEKIVKAERELVNEDALTVTSIKALIKNAGLDILVPDYFEVNPYSDNAGLGGHDYIKVLYGSKPRPKDLKDIDKVKDLMKQKFGNSFSDIDNGFLIKK